MIAACLALLLQGGLTGAYANATSGHCTGLSVTDYVESDVYDATTSTAWQNVTDGRLSFITSSTGCVVITFSATAGVSPPSSGSEVMHVRTLLDGNNLCVPALTNDIFLLGYAAIVESANSTTRICKNVAPGTHTLQAQYKSVFGREVDIYGHRLVVTHN